MTIREAARTELYESKSGSLIAHCMVGNALPNERLQPLSMVAVQIHESDGKLTT